MLVITRKKSEKIFIADDIEITVVGIGQTRVRVGIQAPKHVKIQTQGADSSFAATETTVAPNPAQNGRPQLGFLRLPARGNAPASLYYFRSLSAWQTMSITMVLARINTSSCPGAIS